MSALKAAASENTTHHPNVEINGHEKGGQEKMQKHNKQQGRIKNKSKKTNQ